MIVRKTVSNIEAHLQKLQAELPKIPAKAANKFTEATPIRTGNARRKTSLIGNDITANYPYATKLNEGASRQAREGMTTPTVDYIRRLIRNI